MPTKLDQQKTYEDQVIHDLVFGIEHLSKQLRLSWEETRFITVPKAYSGVENIVFIAMGGSALGVEQVLAAFGDRFKVPVTVVNDYVLPNWVSSKTLVFPVSFSGTTQEVIDGLKLARKRKAKIMGVCSGGTLSRSLKRTKHPLYQFQPGELALQPRLGTGFLTGGIAGMLERAGLLRVTGADIDRMVRAMVDVVATSSLEVPTEDNPAKALAEELRGNTVTVIGARHLEAPAHLLVNHLNETAKQQAVHHALPEINHHLLESCQHPQMIVKKTAVVLLHSDLYDATLQKRVELTGTVFERKEMSVVDYHANGSRREEEVAEFMQFTYFVSLYLGLLNGVGLLDIPDVNWFKSQLKKS